MVAFVELENSPREKFSRDGSATLVREFKCDWSDRWTLAAELLSGGVFGLPAQYPGLPGCRVEDVECVPFIAKPGGGDFAGDHENNLVTHEYAKVTATYTPGDQGDDDPELPSDTWATYRQEIGGEIMSSPAQALIWESDNEIVSDDVSPGVFIPNTIHVITWNSVSAPPWGHISTLRGQLNATAWRIPSTGQYLYAETLLFMGATPRTSFSLSSATQTWSLEYRFAEKAVKALNSDGAGAVYNAGSPSATVYGWNHIWRPNGTPPKWDRPVNKDTGDPLFQSGDMSNLFTFQAGF